MAHPRISGRQLRSGSPEESLTSGQTVVVEKRGGNINAKSNQLFQDLPAEGARVKTNLAQVLLEDRE